MKPLTGDMTDLRNKMEVKLDSQEFESVFHAKNKKLQNDYETSLANVVSAIGKVNQKIKKSDEESKSSLKH